MRIDGIETESLIYKPPEKVVVQEEIPKIPQESTVKETQSQEEESLETPPQPPSR